ncbi:hypothetical protein C8P63_103108 [Melghirimyces profundicolus]|uniref:Uncharacterized protein n=1 Tax=Melghirimyces profundicolus TaxID=1242148 RepID=A0A2T6C7M0_9BACL|nr:hypothetical protein [Melghirimyces profundicolus]PTX64324.1 hypothetical protein C8P63_103108 [Melghirimyces profundicolus]
MSGGIFFALVGLPVGIILLAVILYAVTGRNNTEAEARKGGEST